MVTITLNNILPSSVPSNGWKVGYKIKGSTGGYTILPTNFFSQPIQFSTNDPAGTLYEGYIQADCGEGNTSLIYNWLIDCQCKDTYDVNIEGDMCEKILTQPPNIFSSDYCLQASQNIDYTTFESRIYAYPFSNSYLSIPPGTISVEIPYRMNFNTYWVNFGNSTSDGPLNRESVWIDSDCNEIKDPLQSGQQTTLATNYYNTLGSRVVYVGIAADNHFILNVNGNVIADTLLAGVSSDVPFKIWHIIPVEIQSGSNFFNLIATGDGSTNDSMGMVIYDNTPLELYSATNDGQLNILFASHSLRGTTYTVATCPVGWSLDVENGVYICKRKLFLTCNTNLP